MRKLFVFLSTVFMCAIAFAATETVNWYVDGTTYTTTTCQTGGDITLQTAPVKRGHTFTGWAVALYDFSTLDYTIDGAHIQGLSTYTWATTFPYGKVSGQALCSVTLGTLAVAGTPDETTSGGQNCWCKATNYKPKDSNINYESQISLPWVFDNDNGTASNCISNCASRCNSRFADRSDFRKTAFGITQ